MTDTLTSEELDEESSCRQPCDPDVGCGECSAYWDRMVDGGFWNREQHRWTDKAWAEMAGF